MIIVSTFILAGTALLVVLSAWSATRYLRLCSRSMVRGYISRVKNLERRIEFLESTDPLKRRDLVRDLRASLTVAGFRCEAVCALHDQLFDENSRKILEVETSPGPEELDMAFLRGAKVVDAAIQERGYAPTQLWRMNMSNDTTMENEHE